MSREGAVKEEMSPHLGKSPHQQGDQPEQRESFQPQRREQQLVCGRQNGD